MAAPQTPREPNSQEAQDKDFLRILGELERLIRADEAALIRQDFQHLAENQKLKGAFIRKLTDLSEFGVPAGCEKRLQAAFKAQSDNAAWLDDSMQANRDELASLVKGRRTVRRLNSSYGTPNRPSARRQNKSDTRLPQTRFIDVA